MGGGGRLLTLTLCRPDRLNAFTVEMGTELIDAFRRASDDDEVSAVIVTGAGRAFCAGMDLSTSGNVFGVDESLSPTMEDMDENIDDPKIAKGVRDVGGRLTLSIYECKKPVIAAINGAAVGIGITMTLAMDQRLASTSAKFGFVFTKIGIVPDACSTWFLPRLVGIAQALEWNYRADLFDAAEAKRSHLVKEVYTPDILISEARVLAKSFVHQRSSVSIALARQMFNRNSMLADPFAAHKVESLALFYTSIGDGTEGVQAFLEKRPPSFAGKASDMPDFYHWWKK